jgi:threonine/homoserine/homoserine lactone efflux protein
VAVFSGIDNLGLFIMAGILLNLTPGPDVLYIVTHALKSGWRAGAVAALGITAGCFVHAVAAALGVSALLAASSTAFSALKWLGAAYLVYVGWSMLRAGGAGRAKPSLNLPAREELPLRLAPAEAPALRRIFMKGFWTNVLNPKVALFFLAFLPQFIATGAYDKSLSFVLLGLIFNFNSLWVNLAYAWVGAAVSQQFSALQQGMVWLERVAGAMFLGFGLKLALTDNPSN